MGAVFYQLIDKNTGKPVFDEYGSPVLCNEAGEVFFAELIPAVKA